MSTPEHSAAEWAKAGGVVASAAIVGAVIGYAFEHAYVGLVLGVGAGLAINWYTECGVCRDHAAAMAAQARA